MTNFRRTVDLTVAHIRLIMFTSYGIPYYEDEHLHKKNA